MKSRTRKLLTAAIGVGSVSYVMGCSNDTGDGGLTSGNLVAPPTDWPYTTGPVSDTHADDAGSNTATEDDASSTRDTDETSSSSARSDTLDVDAASDGGSEATASDLDAATPDTDAASPDASFDASPDASQ